MYTGSLRSLIDELGRLPGVGPKSAQRIAFHLLKVPTEDALRLSGAIVAVKEQTTLCARCFNVAEGGELCGYLQRRPAGRHHGVRGGGPPRHRGGGADPPVPRPLPRAAAGRLNPLEGVGPEQLRVRELLGRVEGEGVSEVILCTNPNLEGEATAMYLARLLNPLGVRVTRIASGLPVGGDLEYADELTLGRALEGRRGRGGGLDRTAARCGCSGTPRP